ncbi:MAG: tyrosine--tRNA ligase [Candidatus Omnitrophica bacterium]|nr:tyrosine--tRNA ligase [Candidatus Omnitrophota bacterium]
MDPTISDHLKIIKENAAELIAESELITKLKNSLKENKPLKLKIGFDPTACDIHLGHTVLLKKLRKLQDLGHQVYFIIGDFTAKIGDPSGKTTTRPVLTDKQIKINALTYTKQAFKILDKKKTTIIYNSIWYKKMDLSKFLELLGSYTIARVLERDDFSKRMSQGKPLTLLEIIYPLIQGYDSYKLEADIEFGGTDQKFNLIVGRHLQENFNQAPQCLVTMPLLVGTDGKNKMSKSLGNYIGITESPDSIFGKVMSISDELMAEYVKLLYDGDREALKVMHPKEAKLTLAESIVSFYHSESLAKKARLGFEKVFSKGGLPEEIPTYRVKDSKIDIAEVLQKSGLIVSKNEVRRLLQQGAISVVDGADSKKHHVLSEQILEMSSPELILKVGKKKFLKVVL